MGCVLAFKCYPANSVPDDPDIRVCDHQTAHDSSDNAMSVGQPYTFVYIDNIYIDIY